MGGRREEGTSLSGLANERVQWYTTDVRNLLTFFLVFGLVLFAFGEEEVGTPVSWQCGVAGGMMLPGNGNSLRRAAAVVVRGGWSVTDDLAFETELACVPHASSREGGATISAVSARALFHLTGWETFDKLFGSERLDPFVTAGLQATFASRYVFAEDSHRTGIGPCLGVGTFYHLTESWSLRFDATATMAVDSPCGMLYGVTLGIQKSFGDGE